MRRLALLFLPLLAACAGSEKAGPGFTTNESEVVINASPLLGGLYKTAPDPSKPKPLDASRPEAPRAQERVMIYNGSIAIQIPDPREAEGAIGAIAKEMGGWVHRLERQQITLRVPAAKFDATLDRLAALGQVIDKKIAATDVTDQFRDLRIRLENAEKIRARFAALLDKAKDVKEALEVEKELGRVTEEIERLKGQLAAMQDQIAFSTIVVDLQRTMPAHARPTRLPFPWIQRLGVDTLFRFER